MLLAAGMISLAFSKKEAEELVKWMAELSNGADKTRSYAFLFVLTFWMLALISILILLIEDVRI